MARNLTLASLAVLLAVASCSTEKGTVQTAAEHSYTPQASFCVTPRTGDSPLCPVIPGDIGPDPALRLVAGYSGIEGEHPTSAEEDVQTPFDNLSWQTFVALNWTQGKEDEPAETGLQGDGPRVWEGWLRASDVFGDGKVQADCDPPPPGVKVFSIASNGKGQPVGHNEEFIQAATGDPLIDVEGNWTIYERRLNDVEAAYLRAPRGKTDWTLTTLQGQQNLIHAKVPVDFPAAGPDSATGSIEIKATWRVLDAAQRAQNRERFYVVPALLKVAPDLVKQRTPICARVDMGLVAMHVIHKNPETENALLPEWFWSTFEHVDNAPLADDPCDPASPETCGWLNKSSTEDKLDCTPDLPSDPPRYSFFNTACPGCDVNQPPRPSPARPQYAWNATQPYAGIYLTSSGPQVKVGTQVSRCWEIYSLTGDLNRQWRGELARAGSVFQNYMLVGTQWGAGVDGFIPNVPGTAVPRLLSNTVVETYLQTISAADDPFNTGSCVACHSAATLPNTYTSSNFSYLPYLAVPELVREEMIEMRGKRP
jgi:hypothetical protein